MNKEDLVEVVIAEVMRRLAPMEMQESARVSQKQVLAIFTGGTIGFTQSLIELQKMQADHFAVSIVLSEAAEKMIDVHQIQEYLGSTINLVTTHSSYPSKLLRQVDLVLVPVLTRNTAAKIAHNVADTLPSNLIMQALLLGKPVVAASDAAEPQDSWCSNNTIGKCPPALLEALRQNLKKLEAYGIELVQANTLASSCQKVMDRMFKKTSCLEQRAVQGASQRKKSVLDAEMIRVAASQGLKSVTVTKDTIITPLAKDVAREFCVEIIQQPNS